MKKKLLLFGMLVMVSITFSLFQSCGENTVGTNSADSGNTGPDTGGDSATDGFFTPAGPVHCTIYRPGYGNTPVADFSVEKEGEAKMDFSPSVSGNILVLASRDGAYSELYETEQGETITIDLDPVEENDAYHGVYFSYDADSRSPTLTIERNGDLQFLSDGENPSTRADSNGRFSITLSESADNVSVYDSYERSDNVPFSPDENYKYDDIIMAHYADNGNTGDTAKPNIYLYPETIIEDLSVRIHFPRGGRITKSDPAYGSGWDVTVEPDGTIDDYHTFLFYEAAVPPEYQEEKGYVVARDDLEYFFTDHLKQSGFRGQEIDDFLEWWIHRLQDSPYYVIYPQFENNIKKLIDITFSVQPDNFRRLYYLIKRTDNPERFSDLRPPAIPPFERRGFFAVDWGVVFYHKIQEVR